MMKLAHRTKTILAPIAAALLLGVAPTTQGALLTFSGHIVAVVADDANARYHQTAIDDVFSGSFSYGDSAGAPDTLEPNEADYEFDGPPFGGSITNGNTPTVSESMSVNIQNNHQVDADEAALANLLVGAGVVTVGQQIDVWSASATEIGASFDDDDELTDGHVFEIFFVSLDGTLYDDLNFRAAPPSPDQVNLIGFSIEEGDDDGETLFAAFGIVDTTDIPEPATAWLLLSGAGVLMAGSRRRRC